jgi:hypothetical protein
MGHPSLSIPSHTYVPGPHKSIYHSWANNCAATNTTNGVKQTSEGETSDTLAPLLTRASLSDASQPNPAIDLPEHYVPTLEPTNNGSAGPIKSYILPGKNTGVVRVLNFCSVLSAMTC